MLRTVINQRLLRKVSGNHSFTAICFITLFTIAFTAFCETNLALGRMNFTSASSVQDNNQTLYGPGNAVDGKDINSGSTRWGSQYYNNPNADQQWIMIDLGATATVNRVTLKWEAAAGKNYTVDISANGSTNWINLGTKTNMSAGPRTDDFTGFSQSGRYIRMNGTLRATAYGYSLYEFEVYGDVSSKPGVVRDIDGNLYRTIILGSQEWTITNLKTTRLNDGTPIRNVIDNQDWEHLDEPGYCWYENNIANKDKYGAFYNWYVVDTKKLAPTGWRVPTNEDWTKLENFLIANGFNWDGTTTGNKIAKSMAAGVWTNTSTPGMVGNNSIINNKSCFSGFPVGVRYQNGTFSGQTTDCIWWVAFPEFNAGRGYLRNLNCDFEFLSTEDESKNCGFSVRVVRDVN